MNERWLDEWPTPWPDANRTPRLPVIMITTRDETGIAYEVRVSTDLRGVEEGEGEIAVWSYNQDFGQREATRAGGAAFRYAAIEQQRIADEWVKAIGSVYD